MKYSKYMFMIFIMFFVVFFGCYTSSANKEFITKDKLSKVINSKNIDRVLDTLNEVKKMSYQGEILPFIKDLWNLDKKEHTDLAWNIVKKDIVRVEIANILVQAERNELINIKKDDIHNYILSLLNSKDVYVVQKAITTLGLFDCKSDVDDILSIAKKQNKITFRVAVITLANMCNSASYKALDQLFKFINDKQLKQYIINTREKAKKFKKRTKWCNENE